MNIPGQEQPPTTENVPTTRRVSRTLTSDSPLHKRPVAIQIVDHVLGDAYVQQVLIGIQETARRNQIEVREASYADDEDSSALIRIGGGTRAEGDTRPQIRIGPLRPSDDFITLGCDDVGGAASQVEHLRGLGHRRIALVCGSDKKDVWRERRRGWTEAMTAAGLPTDLDLVVSSQNINLVVKEIVAAWRNGLRCTAICAACDSLAEAVYRAAEELGLRIPRDLSITGFGDLDVAARLVPPLTTIQVPKQGLGMAAIEALIQLSNNDTPPSRQLPVRLIRRASVAAPHLP